MSSFADLDLGQTRTLRDLPQIVLAAYFLKRSFGDCLVANKSVPVGEIMSVVQNCQLTENAAFMVVMSLMTSAVYLGCAHRTVCSLFGPKLSYFRTPALSGSMGVWGCRQDRANPARRRPLAREKRVGSQAPTGARAARIGSLFPCNLGQHRLWTSYRSGPGILARWAMLVLGALSRVLLVLPIPCCLPAGPGVQFQ